MLQLFEPRWTYTTPDRLTKWYGHVDYYGKYVIGQWFALNAETGSEYWSRRFFRPTTVCDCAHDVIVASETRSDGPWTADFGIYGIHAQTGQLLWTSHGRGLWGRLLRGVDYIPAFTNELRDAPRGVVDRFVITQRNRVLDIETGRDCANVNVTLPPRPERLAPDRELFDNKVLLVGRREIIIDRTRDDFVICCRDEAATEVWRFSSLERKVHVDGNYYSYRLIGNRIIMILGDAPKTVPLKPENPLYHQPNPADYSLGILDIATGNCNILPLANAAGVTECRIEAVRDSRLLVSSDNKHLAEYELAS